jgi:hypothetical protein
LKSLFAFLLLQIIADKGKHFNYLDKQISFTLKIEYLFKSGAVLLLDERITLLGSFPVHLFLVELHELLLEISEILAMLFGVALNPVLNIYLLTHSFLLLI